MKFLIWYPRIHRLLIFCECYSLPSLIVQMAFLNSVAASGSSFTPTLVHKHKNLGKETEIITAVPRWWTQDGSMEF